MSELAIEIKDLRVDYGDFVAVKDISLSIPYGVVYGLVGPNGAGKTSTFRVLTTLMEPTYGEVKVAGFDIFEKAGEARKVMGYMPDLAPVPSDLKLWEFLDFHADTHRLGGRAVRRKRVEECLATVNLSEKRNAWCKELSRGQTQRLVLAKTLLHRPKVLILDEPASGLDPLSRRELRFALQALAKEGATVIVSSHILSELAEMCSSLCVMNQGGMLASGTVDEVRKALGRAERTLTAVTFGDPAKVAGWLENQAGVTVSKVEGHRVTLKFVGEDEGQELLLRGLVNEGLSIRSFEEGSSSFEDILVEVAEGNRES
ncbi:ABC transporter ATP-binding protein [Verrucomicrobiaceae bacterium 227]